MKKHTLLTSLTILGIICCVELAVVYYQANYNPYAEPSFCNINDFVDCDSVAQTSKSVFLGIPLTYWGFILYGFILMLLNVETLKKVRGLWFLKVFKNPYSYISVLGIISFIISIILAVVSVVLIEKICVLCFVTYFINLAIGIIATDFKNGGIIKSLKDSVKDFIDGVKECTLPFITAVIFIGLFLTYTTIEMPFASRKQSIKHYMLMKHNPYKVSGNTLGNPNGKVRVDLYSDYKCPVCYSYNIMLHKIAKRNKDVFIVHHNFPLDKECNRYIEHQIHADSCRMAKYSISAGNQGKYWDMANLLYENPPETEADALKLAQEIGLDVERFAKDVHSKETYDKLQKEIYETISLGIDGTPYVIINGKRYFGAKAYYELERAVKNP